MSWVTIAVTVGSAIVGMEQQKQVAKKQDNQLAAQLRQQSASEDKVRARTQQFIKGQQDQTVQPQRTAAAQQFSDAVKANQNMSTQPLANVGNVSDAYKTASKNAALGVADFAKTRGDTVAGMEAPAMQRQQNQRAIADYGIDAGMINRGQRGQDFLAQMKLNSIHANPWVSMLTQGARAYAMGQAGGGSGGGSSGYDLSGNTAAGGIDLSGSY